MSIIADDIQLIFSPQGSTLEKLERTLTPPRKRLAENILKDIKKLTKSGVSNHNLILGPRGSGKTHLISYIYKKVKTNKYYNNKLRIIKLSEEELGISSLTRFLISCLESFNILIDDIINKIDAETNKQKEFNAISYFKEMFGKLPVVILIENLDLIFDQLKKSVLLDIRAFLQHNNNITLITSAISIYNNSNNQDHPFYGFFNIHPLEPLKFNEALSLMMTLAKEKGDNKLSNILSKKEAIGRVQTIYNMTGGNHRLLSMLFHFIDKNTFVNIVNPFIEMADRELTPYYQQRLLKLSPQQNNIIKTIANKLGEAISVKTIAQYTLLSSQTVSSQLYDLMQSGLVQRTQVGRESFYELREPLLRIVFDLKAGRSNPLSLIIKLLSNWYTVKELTNMYKECDSGDFEREYYKEALILKEESIDEKYDECNDNIQVKKIVTLLKKGADLGKQNLNNEAIKVFNDIINQFHTNDKIEIIEQVVRAYLNKGYALVQQKNYIKANETFNEIFNKYQELSKPSIVRLVVKALMLKCDSLENQGNLKEAIIIYNNLVKKYKDIDEIEILELVQFAFLKKASILKNTGQYEEEFIAYSESVEFILLRNDDEISLNNNFLMNLAIVINSISTNRTQLKKIILLFKNRINVFKLCLIFWIQMSPKTFSGFKIKFLEKIQNQLYVISEYNEFKIIINILEAQKLYSEGNKKALLKLPIEIRQLLEE